jgi:protein phosphatase
MQSWALTDPGCVRTENQDSYQLKKLDRNTLLCVVCDGMGGAKAGNVASNMAAVVFSREVERYYRSNMDVDSLNDLLRQAVKLANFTVHDQSGRVEEYEGMGTTLVAAVVRGRTVTVVNVGDSRAYRINDEDIQMITTDHSLVQLMIQRGELRPDQARYFPGKNYITRAIGTEPTVVCDIFRQELLRGEYLLLCSDGLTNLVDDQEILFELLHGGSQEDCCQRLLAIAKNRGAPDNVTSILVRV